MVELTIETKLIMLSVGLVLSVVGVYFLSSYRKLMKIFIGAILLGAGILSILLGAGILKFGF